VIALTLGEIADLTAGVVADVDPSVVVTGPVVADSRRVQPGCLFVAVPGERVDGHDFAARAIAAGARAVLSQRPVAVPSVVVDDTVLALGRLAHGYLDRLTQPTIVGITGSSGKTSTKDIVGSLLAELGSTVAPEGSFNTEVGLPLTVLRSEADTRFLVLEFSARRIGHIAYLCGIASPRIGVVLNVGSAHLGEFGSIAAVAKAKGEMVESLPSDGVAVLNADDDRVWQMRSRTSARVVTFGTTAEADVRAERVEVDDLVRPSFRLVTPTGSCRVGLNLHGAHQVSNALAAAAVALELGADVEAVGQALGRVHQLSRWRMQVSHRADGVTVINDAYNANPDSMRAALAALAAMGRTGRRTYAVVGTMAELGDESASAHRNVGAAVAALGVRHLVVVGGAAAEAAEGARDAGMSRAAITEVADVDAAVAFLEADLAPDDVVLVKASRSADLQRVAEALLAAAPTNEAVR
jgi:UDP-N-acetylmuramoyl-tripeptide--D-alanyl-D-alanine ligase